MYTRKSTLLKLEEVEKKSQHLIEMHCEDNALQNVLKYNPLIVYTISNSQQRKWFRKVESITYITTFLTEKAILNFIIDENGIERIISVSIKNLHAIKEYTPVTIGNKTVEDSGFELQAVFNGLGLTEVRTKMSSYFLPVEKGEIYEMVKNKIKANTFQGIVETTNFYKK